MSRPLLSWKGRPGVAAISREGRRWNGPRRIVVLACRLGLPEPTHLAPRHDTWRSDTRLYAAFVAQGRLYVWTENALLMPEGTVGGPLADSVGQGQEAPWHCWLTLNGQPDPHLPAYHRVVIAGGCAVLAAKENFLLAGLYPGRADDVVSLNIGVPLAQAASAGWWVAWSRQSARAILSFAPITASWRKLDYQQVPDVPPESAPRVNTPLAMQDEMAYWIGEKGDLWQFDCRCRDLQRLTEGLAGAQRVWRANDGLHVVRATGDGLVVGLNAVTQERTLRFAQAGGGPLQEVLASSTLIAVVGEKVETLNAQTGDTIGGGKYSGQWIAGALAEARPDAADQEPRLLMLTYDMGKGNLTGLAPLLRRRRGRLA